MRVAIVQSSYIPWRGYFAMIARCDRFIFLDSVEFTRRDWRTRNRIKTANGPIWLTIPVQQRGNYRAPIDAIRTADPGWWQQHLKTIDLSYRRAAFHREVFDDLQAAYASACISTSLSSINQSLATFVCEALLIRTPLQRDVDLIPRERLQMLDPTERLVELARSAGASTYLTGPSARAYLDERRFSAAGIAVEWMDYGPLTPYAQLWGAFEPAVSIVDTALNLGWAATRASLTA